MRWGMPEEITDENLSTYLAASLSDIDGGLTYDNMYNALTAYYRGDAKLTPEQETAFKEVFDTIPEIMRDLYASDYDFKAMSNINYYGEDVTNLLMAIQSGDATVEELTEAALELYGAFKIFNADPYNEISTEDGEAQRYLSAGGGIGHYYATHEDEAQDLRNITERINAHTAEREAREAEIARNQEAAERLSNRLVLDMVEEAIATGDTSKLTTEAIQQFDSIVGSDQYGTVKDLKDDAWAKENIYNKDNGLFSYDLGYSIQSAYGKEFYDPSVAEAVMQLMEDHYLLHYREAKALGQTLEDFYAENPSKYVSPADLRES